MIRSKSFVWAALALTVLLLAAFTRWHDLAAQSLWNDEGNSLRLAQRSIPDLIDSTANDIHPPGYYLLLKAWIGVAGESEFGLRALSALQGLAAVALAIALGRALFGRSAALIAGLLVALSPLAVYYSQETRMYAQLNLLCVAGLWLLVMWLRRRDARWGAALALVNAAGLYTQYSYPFTMAAQGVGFVLWLFVTRPANLRRTLIAYVALNLLTLALFAPWLPTAWDQITQWPRTGVDLALSERLRTVFTWITYGSTAGGITAWALVGPGLLAAAGVWFSWRERRIWQAGLPLVWAGIVIGALFVSGAYREANLKFLLPAQIAAALLIGRGVCGLWESGRMRAASRLIAAGGLFLLVIGQIDALHALYTDPAYARDNYRAMVAQITADPRPGDAIILDAPNQWETFTYYYHGSAPVYPLPRGLGGDDTQTRADVQAILADHSRVFVLFWGESERDPHRVVQAVLDAGAYPVESEWFGDVRLARYEVLAAPPTEPQVQTQVRFGEHITLTGYALSPSESGDVMGVTLFWQTDAPLDVRYKVTVQLFAADDSLLFQHDSEPANNLALTTTWEPGTTVIDAHGLVMSPGASAILIGLYDINAPLNRLPVTVDGVPVGDHFVLFFQ